MLHVCLIHTYKRFINHHYTSDYNLASKFCNFTVYLKQFELVNQNSGIIYNVFQLLPCFHLLYAVQKI